MTPNTDIIDEWIKTNRKFLPISTLEELEIIIKETERGYTNSELLRIMVLATAANTALEVASEAVRGVLGGTISRHSATPHRKA